MLGKTVFFVKHYIHNWSNLLVKIIIYLEAEVLGEKVNCNTMYIVGEIALGEIS
jgi:hypothetical protein